MSDDGRPRVDASAASGQVVLGVVLITVGLAWLGSRLGLFDLRARTVLPLALVVLGAGLIARSFRGPSPGLVVLGVVLSIVTILAAAGPVEALSSGVGDRTYRPQTAEELEESYELGVGTLTLDLSDLRFEGTVDLEARVAIGELRVVLPQGAVEVSGEAGIGEVDLLGSRSDGIGPSRVHRSEDFETADRRVVLDLSVFVGAVEVDR